LREVELMKSLNHPFVIQFVEFIEEDEYYYVILEYLTGGELFDRITQREFYSEDVARDCVAVICTGIKYIHDNNIVHRYIL
jgi:serine/threonine protein kinase